MGKTCGFGKVCTGPGDCASTFCVVGACDASVMTTFPLQTSPYRLAVDLNNAYVTVYGSGGEFVTKVPLNGTAPSNLVTGGGLSTFEGIAVDTIWVYYADYYGNSINKMQLTGAGSPVTVATGQKGPSSIAIDVNNKVYWVNSMDGASTPRRSAGAAR